jgi:predicted O-methyltransferase YrrM
VSQSWLDVDALLQSRLLAADNALDAALTDAAVAGLPPISVSPLQGGFLYVLARAVGASRILEFGTLAGYSTIWLARALAAGGRVTTLEVNPAYAEVARANLARAGVADRVDVLVGPAASTLPTLETQTFDLTFIDADKASTADYFDWAVAHTRSAGLVVVDNVVRGGAVLDDSEDDGNVAGVRRFLDAAGRDPRVTVTALQTVGAKGHDGFALAVVH